MSLRLFMVAGETSGDRLGGDMLQELKKLGSEISAEGIGGAKMIAAGLTSLFPIDQFQVMGFTQIISALPRLWRHGQTLKKRILETNPDAVILIDYPGFNLRLAQALRRSGYRGKIIQYGCPTFWAWGKKRQQILIDNYDLLLTLFPFEAELFANTSLKAIFVGHPLLKAVNAYRQDKNWQEKLDAGKQVIALFPGSRHWEIEYNLPLQLAAAKALQHQFPETVIAASMIYPEMLPEGVIPVDPSRNYDLMNIAHVAFAKSGTITLELALHQVPTVVTYVSSHINRWIAGYLLRIRLPFYCMTNILTGTKTFPEFIEKTPTANQLKGALAELFKEGKAREQCLEECRHLRIKMENQQGSNSAAQAIKELLCGTK